MFNHYYAQREKYQDYIKEAEKERIINQIQESRKSEEGKSGEPEHGSLANRLGLIFRDARLISSR